MIQLNPDEIRDRIIEVVESHLDEWGYDSESRAKAESLVDDLYKLVDEIVTDVAEEEEQE